MLETEGLEDRGGWIGEDAFADSFSCEIRASERFGRVEEGGCGSVAAGRKCFAVLSRCIGRPGLYVSSYERMHVYMCICVIATRLRMLAVVFCWWFACSVLSDFHRDSEAGNQHTKPSAPYFSSVFYFQMLAEYFAGRVVMF